jgi:hypothetical protein
MRRPRSLCRTIILSGVGVGVGVVLLVAVLATLAPGVASADDTSLGAVGGTVVARPSADIRMSAETVQAVCFGSFAEFRVDFRFVNEGRARSVRLGFPFSRAIGGEHGGERPFGFQAWQGKRPLRVSVVGVGGGAMYGDAQGYFVHTARFPHGESTITVSYLAQVSVRAGYRKSGDATSGGAHWYEYWLHTGRTWKGPIGAAVVRFALADTFCGDGIGLTAEEADEYAPVTTPGWAQPLPGVYQWRRGAFEPEPAQGRDWWNAQAKSDVILGFGQDWEQGQNRQKWSASGSAPLPNGAGEAQSAGDGALGTCWTAGPLAEEDHPWVQSTFRRPRRIREVRIVSGNNSYVAAFSRYGRPRTMTAAFSDGSSVVLHLADAPVLQRFPVDATTTSVKLTVDEVFPGSDYPAVCVSEVEFGGAAAPSYAAFSELLANDDAAGRLPASAGRVTGGIRAAGRVDEWEARSDAESVAGGDLIGVDEIESFPTDAAPFRRPATLDEIAERFPEVVLPPEALVGTPVAVDALSKWTFDIRYASGVELLVNAKVARPGRTSVLKELLEESRYVGEYTDGRKLPYEVTTVGKRVVGVARPGTITCSCEEGDAVRVPAQMFWRDGAVTYHLYARTRDVKLEDLTAAATQMLEGPPLPVGPPAAPERHPWWWAVVLSAALVALAAFLIRRAARPVPAQE